MTTVEPTAEGSYGEPGAGLLRPALIDIPSPEAPTTIGRAEAGGAAIAARVAKLVDETVEMVHRSKTAAVDIAQIRRDSDELLRDFHATFERLRKADKARRGQA